MRERKKYGERESNGLSVVVGGYPRPTRRASVPPSPAPPSPPESRLGTRGTAQRLARGLRSGAPGPPSHSGELSLAARTAKSQGQGKGRGPRQSGGGVWVGSLAGRAGRQSGEKAGKAAARLSQPALAATAKATRTGAAIGRRQGVAPNRFGTVLGRAALALAKK